MKLKKFNESFFDSVEKDKNLEDLYINLNEDQEATDEIVSTVNKLMDDIDYLTSTENYNDAINCIIYMLEKSKN